MAEFKTAHSQLTLPLDVVVVGTVTAGTEVTAANRKAAICRGDFVVLTPASGVVPAYITKATGAQVTAKTATHIVALTDQTIGAGHVRTDEMNYKPSELVGAQVTTAPSGATTTKKVGLWPIFDWGDVIPDADLNDVKS